MTKVNFLLLASLMVTTTAMADSPLLTMPLKKVKVSKLDDGKVHGYTRFHQIFDAEANGFDKNTGSTVGLGLKYGQSFGKYLSIGGEIYGVTETGLQDHDKSVALGMGMGESKKDRAFGYVTGLHLTLKNLPGKSKVSLARSQFKSPMTKTQITHVPNMYQYVRADTGVLGGNLSLSFITDMAYGSRSAADFGLIGEKTGTGGMAISPFSESPNSLIRGKYYNIGDTLTGSANTSGIAVVGYERKINGLKINVWNFRADNILNNLYAEADYKIKMGKGKAVVLSGQYLDQSIDDSSLNTAGNTYGGAFYGVQAKLKYNKLILKAAYNRKDDEGGFYNAWGANPGYTSSIFSRNQYRTDVSAYKGTAVYHIAKNLKVMVSHANYGQSAMQLKTKKGFKGSQTDASETDMVIIYKPKKNVTLKLFNASRTSEFDGIGAFPKTQNQTRLIANYAF